MSSHVVSLRIYFAIFATLLVLTAATVGAAYVDLGPLNIYVAMTIAVIKATLVVLFFMHLRYSSHLTKLFVMAAIVWFTILISLTVSDYYTRSWQAGADGWVPAENATPDPRGVTNH